MQIGDESFYKIITQVFYSYKYGHSTHFLNNSEKAN